MKYLRKYAVSLLCLMFLTKCDLKKKYKKTKKKYIYIDLIYIKKKINLVKVFHLPKMKTHVQFLFLNFNIFFFPS